MGSFFFTLFGIIWLCIVLGSDNKSKKQYQAKVDETTRRSDKWHAKINKGPLNSYQFHEKYCHDRKFREDLLIECNKVIDSIPEMGGIRIDPIYGDSETIMEMMFDARTGDVSYMWFSGYIRVSDLKECFPIGLSVEGCSALMRWYQRELRKNGYPSATILPIVNRGNTLGWYFTDGTYSYDMIKNRFNIQ